MVDGLSIGVGVQWRRRLGLHHRHGQLAGNAADAVGRPWRDRDGRHRRSTSSPRPAATRSRGQGFFSTAGEVVAGQQHRRPAASDRPAAGGRRCTRTGTSRRRVGGPILRDKLWFFGNYRDFGSHDDILGMYGNQNAGNANAWNYVPDPNLKARNAVATHGHGAAPDVAGDAAQQGRLLLRQPAGVRRLVDDHGRRKTAARAARTGWRAAPRQHCARGGQRRAGHGRRRVRLCRHVPARDAGHVDVAGDQPAAARGRRCRPTSASGDGWSSRARS